MDFTNLSKLLPLIISALLGTIFCYGQNSAFQNNSFLIKGVIAGRDTGLVYISYRSSDDEMILDSARIIKGQFILRGKIKHPVLATFRGNRKVRYVSDPEFVEFFIDPDTLFVKLEVKRFKFYELKGGRTQAHHNRLLEAIKPYEDSREDLGIEMERIKDSISNLKDSSNYNSLKDRFDLIWDNFHNADKHIDSVTLDFIKTYPSSYLNPYLLNPYVNKLRTDELFNVFNILPEEVRATFVARKLLNEIEKKKASSAGYYAPDFEVRSLKGDNIKLEAYRWHKFVLLDFWASWCVPCRKTFPGLKKIYKLYADKGFEIISISQDVNLEAWEKAIVDDEIGSWQHVLIAADLKKTYQGIHNPNDIIEKYFINGLPLQILIDKDGRIVKRWDGENEMHLQELEEYLKKL